MKTVTCMHCFDQHDVTDDGTEEWYSDNGDIAQCECEAWVCFECQSNHDAWHDGDY